jgi:hypothetical protein
MLFALWSLTAGEARGQSDSGHNEGDNYNPDYESNRETTALLGFDGYGHWFPQIGFA